jgi:thioredoxin 1
MFSGKLFLHKVNIDEHPDFTRQNHVMSVPTLILFKNGTEVWRMKGFEIASKLYSMLQVHLA